MKINSIKRLTKYLKDDEGDQYLDLSESPFKDRVYTKTQDLYVVTSETEMRLDLISIKYFGTTEYIDIICEANGIFNPFSVKAGDVLVIPLFSSKEEIYKEIKNEKDLRDQFIDDDRLSTKDAERIDRMKEIGKKSKGGVKDPLPPNMNQKGKQTNVLKDGKIWLGTDLTVG